jgi:hypothetical protein
VQRSAPVAPRFRSRAQSTWLSRWRPDSSLIESLERPVDRMWKAARILRKVRPYFSPRCCGRGQAVEKRASLSLGCTGAADQEESGEAFSAADSLGPNPARGRERPKVRSGSAYKELALQVELCLPRLIASCAEPRWRILGFRPGSGRRASPASLLLGAAFRAFSSSSRSPERCFHDNLRGHASDNGLWALLA